LRRDRIEASKPDGDIGSAHKACSVRYRRELVGDIVTAGEHGEYTLRGERRSFVDRSNTCMGVRRAHDHGMHQLRQAYIVGKAALAGEEAKILFAPHRLTNAVRYDGRRVHARYSTYRVGASIVY